MALLIRRAGKNTEGINTMDSTYLTELRQLNELNYARFEAKVEQRVAELGTEFRTGIADLRSDTARMKTELLKWLIGLLVPATIALGGLIIAVMRLR